MLNLSVTVCVVCVTAVHAQKLPSEHDLRLKMQGLVDHLAKMQNDNGGWASCLKLVAVPLPLGLFACVLPGLQI
jgi:hypothetical protein